jgi:hypothetical protein
VEFIPKRDREINALMIVDERLFTGLKIHIFQEEKML